MGGFFLPVLPVTTGVAEPAYYRPLGAFILIGNLYCFLNVLLRARKVRLQIENEAARFGQASINPISRRYIFLGGLIIISMVICFTPTTIMKFMLIYYYKNRYTRRLASWDSTLVMLNSLMNQQKKRRKAWFPYNFSHRRPTGGPPATLRF